MFGSTYHNKIANASVAPIMPVNTRPPNRFANAANPASQKIIVRMLSVRVTGLIHVFDFEVTPLRADMSGRKIKNAETSIVHIEVKSKKSALSFNVMK